MGNYRSAYERYYKNINRAAGGKVDGKSSFHLNSRYINFKSLSEDGLNGKQENYLVKRIIRELIGATLLLVIFVGLKFIPIKQVREAYVFSKQIIVTDFNYDETIQSFNYVKIGNFSVEDLKKENLKAKATEFIEYLKSISNKQFQTMTIQKD